MLDRRLDRERQPDGRVMDSLTLFLAGSECPFTCIFCDLWQYTLDGPTPKGAIPAQIREALEDQPPPGHGTIVKLYNASNYFDPRAVPPADDAAVAELLRPFEQVVVESHAKLVGNRCRQFAERLDGRLQVALGFETAHPEALRRLNKRLDLDDLAAACRRLRQHDIGIRAFVLIGAPFVPQDQALAWLERSVAFALDQGAEIVSLIPLRASEATLRDLIECHAYRPPTLAVIEEAAVLGRAQDPAVVRLDTWDLETFGDGSADDAARLDRLRRQWQVTTADGSSCGG